uniref:Small ribosomal subunit protein bS16m n=1 Tax=Plectus sambesii TaxID=2011161 RepID=A0A914W180_9BILA
MRSIFNPKTFGRQSIGLALFGCGNRPFYQIVVFPDPRFGRKYEKSVIEQVGSFDPLPNARNEKLVALNIDRIKYWVTKDAHISLPVLELLGLAGFYPLHPKTFIRARHAREVDEKLKLQRVPPAVDSAQSAADQSSSNAPVAAQADA